MQKKIFIIISILILMVPLSSCQTLSSVKATSRPDMIAILKTELAALNLEDPVADMERNYTHGDKRFIGIYGIALICPGLEGVSYDFIKRYGVRPIEGTSDAIEGEEHGKLIGLATKYTKSYNRALLDKLKLEEEFYKYYSELLEYRKRPEVMLSSKPSDHNDCEAFRKIVTKGEVFIPFIIEEIKKGDFFLNQAMEEITGFDIRTTLEAKEVTGEQGVSKLWIEWWKKNKDKFKTY